MIGCLQYSPSNEVATRFRLFYTYIATVVGNNCNKTTFVLKVQMTHENANKSGYLTFYVLLLF